MEGVVSPRIFYTDLNSLLCKAMGRTNLQS